MRHSAYTATGSERNSGLRASSALFCFLLLFPLLASAATWSPESEIAAFLKRGFPWAEVEITDLTLSAALPAELPAAIIVEKTPPGKSVFRFDFRAGRSITATAFVKAYDRVLMSRNSFRKGYVLKEQDIYPTLMENGRIPKGALRDEHDIIGKRLLRSVVSNIPLTDAMVARSPIVQRGRKVVLAVDASGFSARTMGELKQDASVGEYVKVVNQLSKKIVTGFLTDENTVRVEY